MMSITRYLFLTLALTTLVAGPALADPPATLDLLTGLQTGQLWAQFRGAGPSGVRGTVGATGGFGGQVGVPSGTQFWPQRPGVQGMTTLGSHTLDLGQQRLAEVLLPTACTNLGLATPTAEDVMIPAPCPDLRLAQLTRALEGRWTPHPVAQLAVWAVADNPPRWMLTPFFQEALGGLWQPGAMQRQRGLLDEAALLLAEAGLEPAQFVMFR